MQERIEFAVKKTLDQHVQRARESGTRIRVLFTTQNSGNRMIEVPFYVIPEDLQYAIIDQEVKDAFYSWGRFEPKQPDEVRLRTSIFLNCRSDRTYWFWEWRDIPFDAIELNDPSSNNSYEPIIRFLRRYIEHNYRPKGHKKFFRGTRR